MHESFQDFAHNGQERNLALVTRCAFVSFLKYRYHQNVFHDAGNVEVLKLRLNNEDELSDIAFAQRRRRRDWIPPKPKALSTFNEDRCFLISCAVQYIV